MNTMYNVKRENNFSTMTFTGTIYTLCRDIFCDTLDRGTQVDPSINYFPNTIDELIDSLNKCSIALDRNCRYTAVSFN